MRRSSIAGVVALVAGALLSMRPSRATDYFLTRDLGIQGIEHLCAYSNGQVYTFPATQLCPLSISDHSASTDDSAPATSPPAITGTGDGDVSLFDSAGEPVAYIDTGTIYLWEGQPVAYLDGGDGSDQYDVYGFNGQHLGWFSGGVIWDHSGYAACAVRQRMMTATQVEPVKGVQQVTPVKQVEQIAPVEPVLMNSFGGSSCKALLASGSD